MRSAMAGLVLLVLSSTSAVAQEDLTPQEKQRLELQQQRREQRTKQQTPADAAAAKPTVQSGAPAAKTPPLTVERRRRQSREAQAAAVGPVQQQTPEGTPQRTHRPQAPRDSANAPPPGLDRQTDAERAAPRERQRNERLQRQQTPAAPVPAPKASPLEGSPQPVRPARADRPVRADRPDRIRPPTSPTGTGPSQTPPLEFHRRAGRTPGEVNRSNTSTQMPDRPRRVGPSLPTRPYRAEASSPRDPDQVQAQRNFRFDATRSLELRRGARARTLAQPSRSFRVGQNTYRSVRAERYRYAPGYHYRVFRRGQRFPATLLLESNVLNNFTDYDLASPQVGYRWVRFGPDALLINLRTSEVSRARYGVFYEGGEPNEGFGYGLEERNLPPIDPRLPEAFLSGELDLSSGDYGGGCDDFYGQPKWRDYVDRAWADEDWNELAGVVIDGSCESDLSYFLLGLAAEGLALPDAAASFYQRALDLNDSAGWNNCDAWDQDACRGVNVGDEAAQALERLYSEPNRPSGYR